MLSRGGFSDNNQVGFRQIWRVVRFQAVNCLETVFCILLFFVIYLFLTDFNYLNKFIWQKLIFVEICCVKTVVYGK